MASFLSKALQKEEDEEGWGKMKTPPAETPAEHEEQILWEKIEDPAEEESKLELPKLPCMEDEQPAETSALEETLCGMPADYAEKILAEFHTPLLESQTNEVDPDLEVPVISETRCGDCDNPPHDFTKMEPYEEIWT